MTPTSLWCRCGAQWHGAKLIEKASHCIADHRVDRFHKGCALTSHEDFLALSHRCKCDCRSRTIGSGVLYCDTPKQIQAIARKTAATLTLRPHGYDEATAIVESVCHAVASLVEQAIADDPDRYKGMKKRIISQAQAEQREQMKAIIEKFIVLCEAEVATFGASIVYAGRCSREKNALFEAIEAAAIRSTDPEKGRT